MLKTNWKCYPRFDNMDLNAGFLHENIEGFRILRIFYDPKPS